MKLLKAAQEKFQNLINSIDNYQARDDCESEIRQLPKLSRSYTINCTGDCCVGDQVAFIERVWDYRAINNFGRKANIVVDFKIIEGKIIKESYGEKKQQHTFTLILPDKTKKLIKGRNLYGIVTFRKAWKDEDYRQSIINEKHMRGRKARRDRNIRKSDYY